MSCRCSEISKCNKDISILGKMIEELTQLGQKDIRIESQLNNLADVSYTAITPQNINSLVADEKKLNDPIRQRRTSMLGECISEKWRLEKACKSMKSEDSDYHKKEEEKKKNNK